MMELLEWLSSGPQGMIVGALIGVIISAVFEDRLVRYLQRFTSAVGRMTGKTRSRVLRRDQAQESRTNGRAPSEMRWESCGGTG